MKKVKSRKNSFYLDEAQPTAQQTSSRLKILLSENLIREKRQTLAPCILRWWSSETRFARKSSKKIFPAFKSGVVELRLANSQEKLMTYISGSLFGFFFFLFVNKNCFIRGNIGMFADM